MKRLDFNSDWNFWKEGGEKQEKVNLPHDAMLSEKRDKDNATQAEHISRVERIIIRRSYIYRKAGKMYFWNVKGFTRIQQ